MEVAGSANWQHHWCVDTSGPSRIPSSLTTCFSLEYSSVCERMGERVPAFYCFVPWCQDVFISLRRYSQLKGVLNPFSQKDVMYWLSLITLFRNLELLDLPSFGKGMKEAAFRLIITEGFFYGFQSQGCSNVLQIKHRTSSLVPAYFLFHEQHRLWMSH